MTFQKLISYANYIDDKGYHMASNVIDMACKESGGSYEHATHKIAVYALLLDADGFRSEADILDVLLHVPGMTKSAELASSDHLYDYEAHRKETLFNSLKYEMAKAVPEQEHMRGGSHPLLTRYSPDYPGVLMLRVEDGVYQDLLSKKVYDFNRGFISDTGIRYQGGSVAHQTSSADALSNAKMESSQLISRPQG